MKLLIAAVCVLLACTSSSPVHAPAPPPHPAAASFVIAPVTHWELPVLASPKLLVRPDGAILAAAVNDEGAMALSVIDPKSLQVIRRGPAFAKSEVFADWTLGADALYVLVDQPDDARHVLLALDPMTFQQLGRSERAGTLHAGSDRAFPPVVEVRSRGIHVYYRRIDAKLPERVVDELHARGDVSRILPSRGEDPPSEEPARSTPWTFDVMHGRITSDDGRVVECPLRGDLIGRAVWSGRRMFVATVGCCGDGPGGFFVCEVPE